MAAIVDYVDDIEFNVSSGGSEIVREKGISANSFSDIVNNNLIPAYGTRHPVFTAFRLVSGSISRTGNDGGKWQGFWRGTYSTSSVSVAMGSGGAGKDPWDLDATDYSVEPLPIEIPMKGGYNSDGDYKELRNTAGSMMQRQQTIYGSEHSFIFCKKDKGSIPTFNQHAIVNSATAKIAGETFAKHTAMLMPPSVSHRTEYKDNGEVLRSYWEIAVKIRVHPLTWITKTLNVGTMARFKDKNGSIIKTPAPIYKYTPWTKAKPEDNFDIKPVYGSLQDVVKAKHTYAMTVSKGVQNDSYYQAFNALPWEEITEPLPLDSKGGVYTDAMEDPDNNPYLTIDLFDTDFGPFSQYSFPKKREG